MYYCICCDKNYEYIDYLEHLKYYGFNTISYNIQNVIDYYENITIIKFNKLTNNQHILIKSKLNNDIIFNNDYIIKKIENNKKNKIKKIIQQLGLKYSLSDDLLLEIYNKSISIHQSNIQGNGNFLENNIVVSELLSKNIKFRQQVTISKDGVIVGFNEKKSKCYHIVDFVIGDNIEIGKSITEYKVISCKTTCRERWTQDDWTYTYIPLKYILLTISNDYPTSIRLRENDKRKIITCYPKIKDDRKFKLNFENLIDELI
jgi:hypothetical protein